jgi:hypothetical protein
VTRPAAATPSACARSGRCTRPRHTGRPVPSQRPTTWVVRHTKPAGPPTSLQRHPASASRRSGKRRSRSGSTAGQQL